MGDIVSKVILGTIIKKKNISLKEKKNKSNVI